ncbi:hypothetical protein ABPG77_003526 [Micractinium sp. CCAP 211/92]
MQAVSSVRAARVALARPAAARSSRGARLVVQAKVDLQGGPRVIRGKCYVTKDNIDTDQIIPAEYLTLVPSKPDEYEKLGSYALIGLPDDLYPTRFVEVDSMKTDYPIIIGGQNFGCGSSREHAPVALGASGANVVVAESYARIFFRNCVSTGELYPVETDVRLCEELETGREVEVDMENDVLTDLTTGKKYSLKPLGDAGPVIDAGGIFEYARSTGMIKAKASA